MPSTSSDKDPIAEVRDAYPVLDFKGRPFIRMAMTRERVTPVGPFYSHVAVNEKGKHVWLQKLCLRLLDKLGAVKHPWRQQEYREVVIERNSAPMLEQLETAWTDLTRNYHRSPTVCFVGPRGLRDLTKASYDLKGMSEPFSFNVDLRTNDKSILGMRVIMLPWLDGIFFA